MKWTTEMIQENDRFTVIVGSYHNVGAGGVTELGTKIWQQTSAYLNGKHYAKRRQQNSKRWAKRIGII